jgi:hypothetical protein
MPGGKGDDTDWVTNETREISDRAARSVNSTVRLRIGGASAAAVGGWTVSSTAPPLDRAARRSQLQQ